MSWVQVKYNMIFRPEETWGAVSDINTDFASWLREKGFEVEVVNDGDEEKSEFTLLISKKQMVEPPKPPKSINKQIQKLAQDRGYDGRFKSGTPKLNTRPK